MTACRSVEEARAAGRETGLTCPPLSQEAADLVAAILAARQPAERRAA